MDVVRHQYVRMNRALVPGSCVGEQTKIQLTIAVDAEAQPTVVTALHHMQRNARQF
jgi:hypothetical protein